MMTDQGPWAEFREAMPVTREWAYFDHASVAPISGPAADVLNEWCRDASEHGGANWKSWRKRVEKTRRTAAAMIGAESSEIAFIRNTTEGINIVAEGLPWKEGDNVVMPRHEFPSNDYPWQHLERRGVEVRKVEWQDGRFSLDALADACDDRTRVVTISWVDYRAGWRHDLDAVAEITRACGALLFVDAIQGVGVFPIDVSDVPIDFLAADGHKWLLAPEGAGLFYVRRSRLKELEPLGIGWNSVKHAGDFANESVVLKDSAARYEGGSFNMAGIHALGASLDLLTHHGIDNIAERLLDVTDRLCSEVERLGSRIISHREPPHASGIVAFDWPDADPLAVREHCRTRKVLLNFRDGHLRASPHAYANSDDIERLCEALRSFRAS